MNDLSVRQLRAFAALAQERHFTRAAALCHLTQPGFSALIRSLEASVGARLFDRSRRHVALTVEGEVFAVSAARLLTEFERAQADIGHHLSQRCGHVAIGALPSLAAGWLPAILADYRADYPAVSLTLVDALADACLDRVRSGELDFALAGQREDMSDLQSEFLHADQYHLICPRTHPLAQAKRVRLADLAAYPLVHMTRNSSVRQRLDQLLSPAAHQVAFEVEHLATAIGLVRAGLGITVMPAMTLFHAAWDDLVCKPLEGQDLTRPLYLIKREGRSLSVAAQAVYDRVRARRDSIGTTRVF